MTRYFTDKMAELADQQVRFAPQAVRHQQIARAEAFLLQMDTDRTARYGFGDVCHQLTGYRAERPDSTVLAGDELAHDLRCFVEDLSESLGLEATDFPGSLLSVRDVSERFSISTKTVDRWRDRGLASRRVLVEGRKRVMIPETTLNRFVEQNPDEVQRGRNFRQLSGDEREQIILAARRLAAEGYGLTDVSRRLGRQFGRATETIRYTLRDFDQTHPENAIFPKAGDQMSSDQQQLAFDLSQKGVAVDDLARRFGRTKSAIRGILADVHAHRVKGLNIDYIDSDEFRMRNAEEIICGPAPEYDDTGRAPRIPSGLPAYLAELYKVPLLNRAQEEHYFRLMNYLKFRAKQYQDQLDVRKPSARTVAKTEEFMARAGEVKAMLIRSNLRLVVSIAKRHLKPGVNFFELVSDGNMSLIRAIEKFDYARGNKFSTYASWAIMKNFARSVPAQHTLLDRFRTGYDELFYDSNDGRGNPFAEELANSAQRSVISEIMKELNGREQKVIACRFGLTSGSEPETLEQVGNRLGVTKERVRQIEVRTLEKLRRIARRKRVDIPGF